jgi:hypothetical protein
VVALGPRAQASLVYIKKYLQKAKEEELWKLKYFIMQKYINLPKIL